MATCYCKIKNYFSESWSGRFLDIHDDFMFSVSIIIINICATVRNTAL